MSDLKPDLLPKGGLLNEKELIQGYLLPVSGKDPFRIVTTLVAHFDLEFQQMDFKIAFRMTSYLKRFICLAGRFDIKAKEYMVCRMKKSLYGFKQGSRHWFSKFDEV